MPEDLRRPIGLRRLAVVGSVGLFALAVFQAQPGCGGAEPEASPPAPELAPEPAEPAPAAAPAEPAPVVAEPAPVIAEPPAPEGDPTPVGVANEPDVSAFIGASKSGFVMEPPRQKKQQKANAQQQAQTPSQAPQQQNARPGT